MNTNTIVLSKEIYDDLRTKEIQLSSLLNHDSTKVITQPLFDKQYLGTGTIVKVVKNEDLPSMQRESDIIATQAISKSNNTIKEQGKIIKKLREDSAKYYLQSRKQPHVISWVTLCVLLSGFSGYLGYLIGGG